jgi:hypothetical protein
VRKQSTRPMNEDIQLITRLSMARFRLNHCVEQMRAHEKAIAEHKAALDALFDKRIDLIHEVRSLMLSEKISRTLNGKEPA